MGLLEVNFHTLNFLTGVNTFVWPKHVFQKGILSLFDDIKR